MSNDHPSTLNIPFPGVRLSTKPQTLNPYPPRALLKLHGVGGPGASFLCHLTWGGGGGGGGGGLLGSELPKDPKGCKGAIRGFFRV